MAQGASARHSSRLRFEAPCALRQTRWSALRLTAGHATGPPVRLRCAPAGDAGRLHKPAAVGLQGAGQGGHRVGRRRLRAHARCVAARVFVTQGPSLRVPVQAADRGAKRRVFFRLSDEAAQGVRRMPGEAAAPRPRAACNTAAAAAAAAAAAGPSGGEPFLPVRGSGEPFLRRLTPSLVARSAGSLHASALPPQLLSVGRAILFGSRCFSRSTR